MFAVLKSLIYNICKKIFIAYEKINFNSKYDRILKAISRGDLLYIKKAYRLRPDIFRSDTSFFVDVAFRMGQIEVARYIINRSFESYFIDWIFHKRINLEQIEIMADLFSYREIYIQSRLLNILEKQDFQKYTIFLSKVKNV